MMTGLLKRLLSPSLSSSSSSRSEPPCLSNLVFGASLLPLLNTPMLLTRSNLLISFVASRPFMTGNWISMSTKWKPPAFHFVTASFPFMARCHRTFSLCIKAPRTRKLMMLSSTINTLIGGTDPSSSPAGILGGSAGVGFLLLLLSGRGDATRRVGGVSCCVRTGESIGAGGVGIGAFETCVCLSFEAEESWRGRFGGRALVTEEGMPPAIVVGEAVLFRGYLGRLLWWTRRAVAPPGDGSAGSCPPLVRTAIEWAGPCGIVEGDGWTTGIGGKYSVWAC